MNVVGKIREQLGDLCGASSRLKKRNIKFSQHASKLITPFEFCSPVLQDATRTSFPPSRCFLATLPCYSFSIYVLFSSLSLFLTSCSPFSLLPNCVKSKNIVVVYCIYQIQMNV